MPAPTGQRGPRRWADLLFGIGLVVTALAQFVPLMPKMPGVNLDPSWMFGLNQALAQKLAMGRDILFTFGPYASVYTHSYHPATDHLMMLGGFYLAACFSLAAYLAFRTAHRLLQALLVLSLAAFVFSPDALLLFYPLLVGTLALDREGPQQRSPVLMLLVSAFGFLPLVKLSTLGPVVGVLGLMAVLCLLRRAWRQLAIIVAVPPLATLLFWLLAGQPRDALVQYFQAAIDLTHGYTEAMALPGNTIEVVIYLLCAASLTVAVWLLRRGEHQAERIIACLLFLGVLFVAFKTGFVRHDWHALMAASLIVLASELAGTMASARTLPRVLFPGLLALAAIAPIHLTPNLWLSGWWHDYSQAFQGLHMRLAEPGRLQSDFAAHMAYLGSRAGLPLLPGTSDTYSYQQTLLVASGNQWNPRPVFQSYAAFTPELAERNRQHLLSHDRPDNLFVSIQSIDNRLPALEDGASWPVMLSAYEPVGLENGYLLLRHRADDGDTAPTAQAATNLTGRLGETIDLPRSDGLQFARIQIALNPLGKLWAFFYKPSEIDITLRTQDGNERKFRLIAGMAQTEFLLSPLIEDAPAFGLLYTGQRLAGRRVTSIRIDSQAWPQLWQDDYRMEISQRSFPTDPRYLATLDLVAPGPGAAGMSTQEIDCPGNIDLPLRNEDKPIAVERGGVVTIQGWLAKSIHNVEVPDSVWLIFEGESGERQLVATRRVVRPDVGEFFGNPAFEASGFSATVDLSGIAGRQTVRLGYREGGSWKLCRASEITLDIRR